MKIPMIDTLYCTFDIEGYPGIAETLLSELEKRKQQAQQNQADKAQASVFMHFGNMAFEVLPNGTAGFAYILHHPFYQIKIAQYRSANVAFLPVMVCIKSEALWCLSPEAAFADIYTLVNEYIGTVTANKVSRVDMCCHTDELDFASADIEHFKGNFRRTNIRFYNRALSGLEFGNRASKVYCRIYDKTLEMKQKGTKLWFHDIWRDHGWDESKAVWNVEFELKRDFFVERCVDDMEGLFASLAAIWHYLTDDWLVLTNHDRTRIENATINPIWQGISGLFDAYEGRPLVKREKQLNMDADALIPALNGYAKKIFALRDTPDIVDAFGGLMDSVVALNKKRGTTFADEVRAVQRVVRGG